MKEGLSNGRVASMVQPGESLSPTILDQQPTMASSSRPSRLTRQTPLASYRHPTHDREMASSSRCARRTRQSIDAPSSGDRTHPSSVMPFTNAGTTANDPSLRVPRVRAHLAVRVRVCRPRLRPLRCLRKRRERDIGANHARIDQARPPC